MLYFFFYYQLESLIALGMVLRTRPNALAIVLPTLREKRKYHDP